MKGSIAVAALAAASMVDSVWAKGNQSSVLDMEFTIEQTEKVVNECKGRFLDTLTMLEPMDQPGKALEDMVLHVCLDYAHFIPRKSTLYSSAPTAPPQNNRNSLTQGTIHN